MIHSKISTAAAISFLGNPILPIDQEIKPPSALEIFFTPNPSKASFRTLNAMCALPSILSPMGTYVGELQEAWQFPSDHLPIGMHYRGLGIASWNVLDSEYMHWVIEKNSQGLSRSLIADTHVYVDETKLTIRDQIVVDTIIQMISHPTHPRDIVALQECGKPFLRHLASRLPDHIKLIEEEGNALLIDQTQFTVLVARSVTGVFSQSATRSFQEIILEHVETKEQFRLINAHLPGDPLGSGRYEFAQYLAQTVDSLMPTLAMGDMNFNELEMRDAFAEQEFPVSFSIHSPYCTNIDPTTRFSKAIDHFFVFDADLTEVVCSRANEVVFSLGTMVHLLEGHGNH